MAKIKSSSINRNKEPIENKENSKINENKENFKINENKENKEIIFINKVKDNINKYTEFYLYDYKKVIDNILINENFKQIQNSGLNISLFEHQKSVVQAMIELENTRIVNINDNDITNKYIQSIDNSYISNNKFIYNSAILSDPPGSGKTFEILSLISLNNIPKSIPEINIIEDCYDKNKLIGHVKIKFNSLIKSTIVFVASSVINQWEDTIKKYTSFTLFKAASIEDLYSLYELIKNKMINKYDIILVKNHKFTKEFLYDDDLFVNPINKIKTKYYYNIISNFTNNHCWKRVVIDDFDTIKLPSMLKPINSLFTWYISSTKKAQNYCMKKKINNSFSSAEEILTNQIYNLNNLIDNKYMYTCLNVHCDPKYLSDSMKISNINYNICVINNRNNKFISAISELHHDEMIQIIEMVNSDMYGNVAELLDIKSKSIVDIFEKLLNNNYNKYRKSIDILDFIEFNKFNKSNRKPLNEHPEYNKNIKYTKTMFLNFHPIEYEYENIDLLIDNIEKEYKIIKADSGKIIERVKNNISNGICPICNDEINKDIDCVINKCCGVILCGECAFKVQGFNASNNPCFNCRSVINRDNIIFIGKEIKLSNIINEEFENKNELFQDKKDMIIIFINNLFSNINNESENMKIKKVDIEFTNILKSNCIMPKNNVKKIILFANYDEILNNIIESLKFNNIKYWKLSGTNDNLSRIVNEFKNYNDNSILIINSIKYSSGINLQFATDIILAHYIIDQNIITQILGRAIRINREYELNIWFMIYNNELSMIEKKYKLKYI